MALVKTLSQYWLRIQSSLFPWLEEELGEVTEKEQKLVTTLELIRIERFTAFSRSLRGRPPKERAAVASKLQLIPISMHLNVGTIASRPPCTSL